MLTPSNPRHTHDEQVTPEQAHYRGSTGLAIGIVGLILGVFIAVVGNGSLALLVLGVSLLLVIGGGLSRMTSRDRSSTTR